MHFWIWILLFQRSISQEGPGKHDWEWRLQRSRWVFSYTVRTNVTSTGSVMFFLIYTAANNSEMSWRLLSAFQSNTSRKFLGLGMLNDVNELMSLSMVVYFFVLSVRPKISQKLLFQRKWNLALKGSMCTTVRISCFLA